MMKTCLPENPRIHSQKYPLTSSTQVPLWRQGLERHSSTFISHCLPISKKGKWINLLQLTTCFVQELHEFMYVLSRVVYQIAIVLNYITEVITPHHVVHETVSSYATFSRDIHSRKPFYFTCHASGTKSFQK